MQTLKLNSTSKNLMMINFQYPPSKKYVILPLKISSDLFKAKNLLKIPMNMPKVSFLKRKVTTPFTLSIAF